MQASFSMDVFEAAPIDGFCGFFDVQFRGSEQNPADCEVLLSTAPDPTGSTHWGQQSLMLHPSITCAPGGRQPSVRPSFALPRTGFQASEDDLNLPGDRIAGDITIVRRKDNHRLMEVKLEHSVKGTSVLAGVAPKRIDCFHME